MNSPGRYWGIPRYCLLLTLVIILSGCVSLPDPEVSQVWNSDVIGVVNASHSLGQTIEIRRDKFNGITVWTSVDLEVLENSSKKEQLLNVDIYTYPEPLNHVYHTTVRLESTPESRPTFISVSPQVNSADKVYFIRLSTDYGSINVFGSNEDVYIGGQAFADMHGMDRDFAFNTTYDFDSKALLVDINHWLQGSWLVIPLLVILLVPGLSVLFLLRGYQTFDIGQIIGISIGLSLAITPLLMLWTSTIGIIWNKSLVFFLCGFITAILIFIYIRKVLVNPEYNISNIKEWIIKKKLSIDHISRSFKTRGSFYLIALLGIFLLSLAVRLIMVRDLATPAWVDSVHHALVTRIILETGALPETYEPYLDIEPTFYHPGFHSQLATFQLLSGLEMHVAMQIFGQVINALIIFAVYSLAVSMTNNKIIGIFAAIISGLFTPMPAYYTSWGRYTQLSGLLILTTAYILFKQAIYRKDSKLISPLLIAASLSASGLFIVHYRATAYLILLIISDMICGYIFVNDNLKFGKLQLGRVLFYASFSALLSLPWLIQAIPNTFMAVLTEPVPVVTRWFADFSWSYLNTALGKQALALGVLGLFWGIIQKKQFAFILLMWVGFLVILANTSVFGLPGGSYINTTSVVISLFIPISILAGYIIRELIQSWEIVFQMKYFQGITIAVVIISITLSFIGAQNIAPILNPVTFLSRNADILAINWVKENIPQEDKILINPFLWGYGLYAGNDGGYWITPLSGRLTVPPPVLYARSPEEEITFVNQTSEYVINNGKDAEGLYNYMILNDLSYIYLGARGGPISSVSLADYPGFREIYNIEGVQIFKVLPVNAK